MATDFDVRFAHPVRDGRSFQSMTCERSGCDDDGVTWCPLCQKVLCLRHDELTPNRMHDCLAGPADDPETAAVLGPD
jgi:hypothetical protein